jgi:hypothetical protein
MSGSGFQKGECFICLRLYREGQGAIAAKSPVPPCESQLGSPPCLVVPQSTRGHLIQLPILNVRFELPVPGLGIKLGKPLAERFQFFGGELFHLSFKIFNFAHMDFCSQGTLTLRVPDGYCKLMSNQ